MRAGRSPWVRRGLTTTAAMLSVAALFVFGFLAGHSGQAGGGDSVLDEAAARIKTNADSPVTEEALHAAAIEGMLGALGDRYASFLATSDYAQFQRLLDGRYTGVGLWLARTSRGTIEVSSVLPASPAARAGLHVGDEVTTVDGRAIEGRDVGDVVAALRGAAGTSVTIGVRRAGGTERIVLQRADVEAKDVVVARPSEVVAQVRVAAFTRGVGKEVRRQVERLRAEEVRGIVLDLRGNPGGLLHEAVEVASVFLDGGTVVSYSGRGVEPQEFRAVGRGDTTLSLVVLVDGGTASAAEVVAGALQDRNRAVVVGSKSYGKGSVQQPFRLSDGSAVELTVARYKTPAGRSLDGVGITPDVDVVATADGSVALRRAVDIIAGIVADVGVPRG